MTIQDQNFDQNQSMQQDYANRGAQAAAPKQAQGNQQPAGLFSWVSLGNDLGRNPMGASPTGEVLTKLKETGEEVLKGLDETFEAKLIPVDRDNYYDLTHSIVILAMRDRQNPHFGVVGRTMILEATGEKFDSKMENIMGRNIEIQKLTSDANTPQLRAIVGEQLRKAFPQTEILMAEATVVPDHFDVTDKARVHELLLNGTMACREQLDSQLPTYYDLNLARSKGDATLTVKPVFTGGQSQVFDAVGNPVRADVQILLGASQNNQNTGLDRTVPIVALGGFVNLVWDPVAPQQAATPWGVPQVQQFPGQMAPTQKYAAQLILTKMESEKLMTVPGQLLALIPALSLREGGMALNAFRPSHNVDKSAVNLRDIGAVNIEVNLSGDQTNGGRGARINTLADSFSDQQFAQLLNLSIQQGLAISLDIAECGPDTWYNSVFAAAAGHTQVAYDTIYEAAMHLTNGNLAKYFQKGEEIVRDEGRIHLGYFIDANDRKRDIREFDYLAVLNATGEHDPRIIEDWSNSWAPGSGMRQEVRLDTRKRIMDALAANIVYTGFGRRVTFSAKFLDALANAARDAGLIMRTNSGYQGPAMFERASGGFGQSVLMGNGSTGLFTVGGFGGGAAQQQGRFGFGRYI